MRYLCCSACSHLFAAQLLQGIQDQGCQLTTKAKGLILAYTVSIVQSHSPALIPLGRDSLTAANTSVCSPPGCQLHTWHCCTPALLLLLLLLQLEQRIAANIEVARQLVAQHKKERALLALKKKRLSEHQLASIHAYLMNVEDMVRCGLQELVKGCSCIYNS
jgi:hypothetical protein